MKKLEKEFYIVLPLSLEGIPCSEGEYDLSFFENYKTEVITINESQFIRMKLDELTILLFSKYGFLLGYGDYCYLNFEDCAKLDDYLKNDYDNFNVNLTKEFLNQLICFCEKAIELKTGLAFIF